ncbi:baseplate J/gp47 family protein [Plastoroseomonas hellenica]|uniref:baseplate J/gp47 family protein n=1 Tax=Plastoroseomonas hellenica TaxID=2687306 RepID=UPI001BAC4498|nr:baseplate J/gp47 family protein [Plastoroseomonas hellenica]MBR0643979.1 baseplate J/gp47 family protein [Plastoroseomonas hellenica]
MSWPLPTPADIAARAAGVAEALMPGTDARSDDTFLGVMAKMLGMGIYDVHLYQQRLAEELLPDTAQDWLERHASIWGVPRLQASRASGNVILAGTAGVVLPSGLALRDSTGALYTTTAGGTITASNITLPVLADVTGAAANLAAGTVLDLVSPFVGLNPQQAAVLAPGLSGGRARESDEALRGRLLARIRQRAQGGTAENYEEWARRANGVAYVAVHSQWMGAGTVGVLIAMEGPAPAEPGDVARAQAAIEAERPLCATVTVAPAQLVPVPLTIRLDPDTVATRASVTAAATAYFRTEAEIGGLLPLSRISEAISSAAGEYSHELLAPVAAIIPSPAELPVLGDITWAA